jgi:hypothetical protein
MYSRKRKLGVNFSDSRCQLAMRLLGRRAAPLLSQTPEPVPATTGDRSTPEPFFPAPCRRRGCRRIYIRAKSAASRSRVSGRDAVRRETFGERLWRNPLKVAETLPALNQVWGSLNRGVLFEQGIEQREMKSLTRNPSAVSSANPHRCLYFSATLAGICPMEPSASLM